MPVTRFVAASAMIASLAAPAAASRPATSPLVAYVHARAADVLGQADASAQGYGALFAVEPGNRRMAMRTYRQAIIAGDRKLAIATARALDAQKALPAEGRLLLVGETIANKDWKGARAQIETLKHEDVFSFLAPSLSAWVTLGARDGDPLALLATGAGGALGGGYLGEQRALITLAEGRVDDGVAAILALGTPGSARSLRLRIAAAAELAQAGHADKAATLLVGDDPALVLARALLAAHKPIPGAIATPVQGVAELLIRVAADINREQAGPLALTLGRTANFIAPDNAEGWLVVSTMLASGDESQTALAALDHVAPDDPLVGAARDLKVQLLLHKGDKDGALKEALAATALPGASAQDWSRAGDIYDALSRHADAAQAYGKALALTGDSKAAWALWLQRGSALEQSGDWAEAKPALEKAVALAPDQAVALNYLGYSELDRHENVDAATKLVEKASALRPDDPAITDSLGWAYYLRGDLARALPALEKAAIASPAQSDINEHLGDAYWAAGRHLEARYAWHAALVVADDKDKLRLSEKVDLGPAVKP
ncbi:MAG: tetratricopeptide repeat protein [Sphingomonadaceae bacterium]|nr:tetratricopeptide repeat protein [Sphingomonadaceae bacterium]